MRTLFMDFETRSSVDIGACGAFKYMEDADFRVLLLAYAFDDEPVKVVEIHGEYPADFLEGLYDPEVRKVAHNAAFERNVIRTDLHYESAPEEWKDTMIMAGVCGLPMSLDGVGKALNLSEEQAKMKEGKALIRFFCCPRKPTKTNPNVWNAPEDAPAKWETFKEYCKRDVETERTIYRMLERWLPSDSEHALYCLDARINEKGMNTDLELVHNAMAMDARFKEELTETAVDMTGLDNPNSTEQVKKWLTDQEGIDVPTLNKKAVADVVAQLTTDKCRDFMTLRAELSKSSTKKYEAIARSACKDGHIRGCFQFYGGARTGRWAGRNVQLQNLPQNHMEDLDLARTLVKQGDYETLKSLYKNVSSTLSELIRTALIPEEGCKFIVADYSAIEARVIAHIAQEGWRLEAFRQGKDIYCASASQMFHVPVEKHGQNAHLRQRGKVAELALGYGGGTSALLAFGADKLGMTDEEMGETVAMWRQASPRICQLWKRLEHAAIKCVVQGTTQFVDKVRFRMDKGILWMMLPSGREIAYFGAKYDYGTGKFDRDRKVLSYMGQNQTTKKWERLSTWGGKLTENLVQATARDCLKETLLTLEAEGYDVRAHVHDEVIISEPIGGRGVADVCEIMARPISWAQGLPLTGAGYEGAYYFKD